MRAIFLCETDEKIFSVYDNETREQLQKIAGIEPKIYKKADVLSSPTQFSDVQIIFSTWGKKYSPPAKIKPDEAVKIILKKLDDKSKETIINLENPEIMEVTFDKQPSIYYYDKKVNLIGKSVYRIKFNTTQDGLLGPLVFYVDKYNGELIGADFRE